MEGAATEALVTELVGGDERFLSLGPDGLDALTLDDVRTAVQAQLRPDLLELSVVGDFASFEEVGGFVGEILFGSWWGGGGPPIPAHEVFVTTRSFLFVATRLVATRLSFRREASFFLFVVKRVVATRASFRREARRRRRRSSHSMCHVVDTLTGFVRGYVLPGVTGTH